MKKIAIGILIGLSFGLATSWTITKEAHAQAINHDAIIDILLAMKTNINQMVQLVEKHKTSALMAGPESVTLTTAQKQQIINRYLAIKADLAAQYAALP